MTPAETSEHDDNVQAGRSALLTGHSGPTFRLQIVYGLNGPEVLDGPEHGLRDGATLCGMPEAAVFAMRHHFSPLGPFACSDCASVALQHGSDPRDFYRSP